MKTILNLIRTRPAAVIAAVSAAISLAASFGLQLSTEQVGAIMAVVTSLGGLGLEVTAKPSPPAPPPAG